MSSRLVVDGTMRRVGVSPRGEGEGGSSACTMRRPSSARGPTRPDGAANVEAFRRLRAGARPLAGRGRAAAAGPLRLELAALLRFYNSGDSCPSLVALPREEDHVVELPCRHVFCAKCTTKWMEATTCPCRLDCRFVDVTGAGRGGKQALDSAAWLPSPTRPTASPTPSTPPDCPRPSRRAGARAVGRPSRRRFAAAVARYRGRRDHATTGSTARESARLARPASARPVVGTLNMPPRSPRSVGAAPRPGVAAAADALPRAALARRGAAARAPAAVAAAAGLPRRRAAPAAERLVVEPPATGRVEASAVTPFRNCLCPNPIHHNPPCCPLARALAPLHISIPRLSTVPPSAVSLVRASFLHRM